MPSMTLPSLSTSLLSADVYQARQANRNAFGVTWLSHFDLLTHSFSKEYSHLWWHDLVFARYPTVTHGDSTRSPALAHSKTSLLIPDPAPSSWESLAFDLDRDTGRSSNRIRFKASLCCLLSGPFCPNVAELTPLILWSKSWLDVE